MVCVWVLCRNKVKLFCLPSFSSFTCTALTFHRCWKAVWMIWNLKQSMKLTHIIGPMIGNESSKDTSKRNYSRNLLQLHGGIGWAKNLPDQCTHWFFLSNMHLNAICNTICFHSFLKWERAWVTYLYIKDGEDKCLVGGNQFPKSFMTGVWRMILIKITEFQK